jgi:predicted CoA-binding protein
MDNERIRDVLVAARTIAVIGLSSSPLRPSHDVAAYLQAHGYRVVPVNPNEREVLGERAYPRLDAVPLEIQIDIACVFRRSSEVGPHADEAIARAGVRCLWMQDGVVDEAAARRARTAGLVVVMDDCILRKHRQLVASD